MVASGCKTARLHISCVHRVESHSLCQITPLTQSCTMSSGILAPPPTQMWPPQTAAARNSPFNVRYLAIVGHGSILTEPTLPDPTTNKNKPVDELARALLSFKRPTRPPGTATVAIIDNFYLGVVLCQMLLLPAC